MVDYEHKRIGKYRPATKREREASCSHIKYEYCTLLQFCFSLHRRVKKMKYFELHYMGVFVSSLKAFRVEEMLLWVT